MTVGTDTLYFTYGALGPTTVTWNGTTYYYAVNAQGDVMGIFDGSGNCVVTYNWDNAWGYNPEPEGTMASTLGTLNPLRYRSYVYDQETELYYLQSRYYNPEIGRFINADAFVSTGQGLIGNNMFAYCGNNPVNRADPSGQYYGSWGEPDTPAGLLGRLIGEWLSQFVEDVAEDVANYDTSNASEEKVIESNYFSNYKGAFVMKTPFNGSFSFGFIGLSSKEKDFNTVKHEYGHVVHYKELGMFRYATDVAVLSLTAAALYNEGKLPYSYYGSSWEAAADLRGGVTRLSNNAPWPDGTESLRHLLGLFFN